MHDVTLICRSFTIVRLVCFVSHSNDMMSWLSNLAENVSCNVLTSCLLWRLGRGRRREHPKDTSKGSCDLRSLRMLHNFRLRTQDNKGFPRVIGRGRRREHPMDTTCVAQLPVAYTQREPRRGQVTFGHIR